MPVLVLGVVGLGALGFAADRTGDAVEKTGDATIKIALASAAVYFIGKKLKVF